MGEHMQKVLYVEDNPLNMALMHHLFKKNLPFVMLLEAETGERGLEMAERQRPDLIILDIGLPGLNGYETLACLRREENTHQIPVLAISAFAQLSDIAKARQAGFAGYITKPIRVRAFTEIVQGLLAEREGQV
ncbi:two-component system cell cycle response regulator DivK [Paenibacillus forsythiae]|uniref:Two-component system cell cycle response regulator DivK n=1 Tax=Paenibacillus forsythiae TaxID=365616 RepID=A0ABU3HA48_9BACL|nr:response regulator [Paenibacillus forsythiae]MDT3427626.1 two-component system cell cycle response regulator DivK [Paenibacillus forsythiae]